MRPFLPSVALLSAAFLWSCQEQGSEPVGPEGLGILVNQAGPHPTRIAPTSAKPGHRFTIVDTPAGRLTDGSVAVFTSSGSANDFSLTTHRPFMAAQGQLSTDIASGEYTVTVRNADGSVFVVGCFNVKTDGG